MSKESDCQQLSFTLHFSKQFSLSFSFLFLMSKRDTGELFCSYFPRRKSQTREREREREPSPCAFVFLAGWRPAVLRCLMTHRGSSNNNNNNMVVLHCWCLVRYDKHADSLWHIVQGRLSFFLPCPQCVFACVLEKKRKEEENARERERRVWFEISRKNKTGWRRGCRMMTMMLMTVVVASCSRQFLSLSEKINESSIFLTHCSLAMFLSVRRSWGSFANDSVIQTDTSLSKSENGNMQCSSSALDIVHGVRMKLQRTSDPFLPFIILGFNIVICSFTFIIT